MSNLTYSQYLVKISNDINNYCVIVQSAIGIPANLLSIIIFAKLMRNKTNMGYLYLWQSGVDLCLLLCYLLLFQSAQTLGINLYILNDAWCKIITFLRRFILHASSWVAVFITFDRFIFVLYGHNERFMFMKKRKYLTLCIVSILFVIMLLDIPNLYFYINVNSCTADNAIIISSDIISILLRTYIPFTLMIVFNVVMVKKAFEKAKIALKRSSTNLTRKEYQFTVAVVAYDIFFLILNFPRSLYFIMYDVNLYSGAFNGNALFSANYSVFNAVTSNIATLVQTFSFLTYLAFNKLYRKELIYSIGKILHITRFRRIYPDLNPSMFSYNPNIIKSQNNINQINVLYHSNNA